MQPFEARVFRFGGFPAPGTGPAPRGCFMVLTDGIFAPKALRIHILLEFWAQRPYYVRLLGPF